MSSWLVRVRVKLCPAVIVTVTEVHALLVHTFASGIDVVPEVLSRSEPVAQS